MSSSVMVVRPEYDYPTRYISAWAEKIIKLAEEKGFRTIDLHKNRAVKKQVEGILSKKNPALVFLNGHGGPNFIVGHDEQVILEAGLNDHLLQSKIIYALSCSSALILGPSSVEKGATAYIGYNDEFALVYDIGKRTRPEEDKLADLFLGPSNQVMVSLLKGHEVQEAYKNSRDFFRRNIMKLLTSAATGEETSSVPYLLWDMECLAYAGNGSAKAV